ncbi:MAG: radical SAM family heme chaperone HemW [Flavobacteriaceae bacterium]
MAGIYIHIPFCKQACHYCDFHFSTSLKHKTHLVKSINKELILRKSELKSEFIETIYFGGGTPSLLSPDEIRSILKTIFNDFEVVLNPEITFEVNPDDIDENYLKVIKKLGVNRLSIGIQSFFTHDLNLMNRSHDALQAEQVLELVSKYFKNFSVDLIYGTPGLTNEMWIKNIDTVLKYNTPHISSYALTIEKDTALSHFINKGIVKPVSDEQSQEQFQILVNKLIDVGFIHYELSNFGKPNKFSKNNSSYWNGGLYLGIGPSAHSYNGKTRSWNIANNLKYISSISKGILPSDVEVLTKIDRYNERIMTGLRTMWGVSFIQIEKDFGKDYLVYLKNRSKSFIREGLLVIDAGALIATSKGKFLVDGIASDLFKLN